MYVKVYKVLCFLLIGSLVHAYMNNNDYKPKSSYYEINRYKNNNRNSYQYFAHRLRHTHANNNRYLNIDNSFQLKTTENPFKKLYVIPSVTTEKNTDDDYDDFDVVDDKTGDTIKNQKKESEEHDEDDDDYDETEADEWQAEEPTEEPTEKTFTEYKWKHFGTRSRVEESRKNQGITNTLSGGVHEAVAHAKRVVQQGACKTPRIRLIKIQNVYPDTGKTYVPHCTLLHRCSDKTGCCKMDSLTCAPKSTERIELYFYTGRPGNYKVEKLAFYNHTECHCVDRSQEPMSRDAAVDDDDHYPIKPDYKTTTVQTIAEPLKRCQCPDLYTPQINQKHCRCDCVDGNRDCMRIKRGKEYFSLKDRMCIQRQECGNPACEFGVYIRMSGRCPRKQEKFDTLSKISTQ